MMIRPFTSTIRQTLTQLESGRVSAVELSRRCTARIDQWQAHTNALCHRVPDRLVEEQSRAADSSYHGRDYVAEGTPRQVRQRRPLEGIPMLVKDNFCVEGAPTTCGSRMLKDFHAPFTATVVEQLRNAGAILLGKTNMDEFGMGSGNVHSYFGPVRSPLGDYVAGGSSGGSAASVASGMCTFALGSDTGGSVRLPASYCGVVGFKPSYGLLSRWGLIAYASSLDTVGLLTTSVDDAHYVFNLLNTYDAKDPASLPVEQRVSRTEQATVRNWKDVRIGVPQEYLLAEMDPTSEAVFAWKRAIALAEEQGATVTPVSLPNTKFALPAYYILACAEAMSNLARYDGNHYGFKADAEKGDGPTSRMVRTRQQGFGAEVKRRLQLGAYVLSAGSFDTHFKQAQRIRRLVQRDFEQAFADVDVLLTPASVSTAPTIRNFTQKSSPVSEYLNDVFTVPASMAGLPALVIPSPAPADSPHRMPLGLQLIGAYNTDHRLLDIGRLFNGET